MSDTPFVVTPAEAAQVSAAVLALGFLTRTALKRAARQAPAGHVLLLGWLTWATTVGALAPFAAAYYTRPEAVTVCQTAPLGTPIPAGARPARAADSTALVDAGLSPEEITMVFANRWHTPGLYARGVSCVTAQPTYRVLHGGWRAVLRTWWTGEVPANGRA